MSKHTKGPWYIGKDFGDQGRHIYAEQRVCDDEGEEWNPLIATTDDDERLVGWQANARLISAAPDLLEALEELLAEYCDCAHEEIYGYAYDKVRSLAMDKAEAAIAKAKGEV